MSNSAPLKVGLHPPLQCARGRSDCRSLHQVISSNVETFVCCGEVLGGATPWPGDDWSLCIYGDSNREGVSGTDIRIFVDRIDMSDIAAVMAVGLSMSVPRENNEDPK